MSEIKKLLDKCDDAYLMDEYEKLIDLCDEILRIEPECENAIGYKGIAYVFLNQPEKALEILEWGEKIHPNNYYIKNNLSMAYYDLGQYEKSLKCSREGLKIKNFDWLCENKIKALIKLGRIEEAIEFYRIIDYDDTDVGDLLIEAGEMEEALKYYHEVLKEDPNNIYAVERIKFITCTNGLDADPQLAGYYLTWIECIRFKYDTKTCPECGGKLLEIVRGKPKKEDDNMYYVDYDNDVDGDYHCTQCDNDFYLGCKGLHVEGDDSNLAAYTKLKIIEIYYALKRGLDKTTISSDELKEKLKTFDDREFDAFISRLKNLDYICEEKGYYKLAR